jgi:hypothetical protein
LRAKVDLLRDFEKALLIYQARPQTREISFGQLRKRAKQLRSDDAIKHAVAQELEPFVVGSTVAAMGQRLAQQVGAVEWVADSAGDGVAVHSLIRRSGLPEYQSTADDGLNSSNRLILANNGTFTEYFALTAVLLISMSSALIPVTLLMPA